MRLFAQQNAAVAFFPLLFPSEQSKLKKKITYDSKVLLILQPTGIRGEE